MSTTATLLNASPLLLAAIAASAFGSAIIGGLGGFGTGVILTAVLVPIVGIKQVLPLLTVAGVIINGGRLWFYRDDIAWRGVWRVLLGAMPASLLGLYAYVNLPARTLTLVFAACLIAIIPLRRWALKRDWKIGANGLIAGGAGFGAISSMVSGTGVFLVTLLLGASFAGPAIVATDAAISVLLDTWKSVIFGSSHLLTRDTFIAGALIGLCTIPGSACAKWLSKRIGAKLHIVFIECMIVVAAMVMLATPVKA